MKNLFDKHQLDINDENFLSLMASIICNKINININELNSYLNEDYTYYSCDDYKSDLIHMYDRFLQEDTRVSTGSYYTPYELAEKMVRMAFHDYFKSWPIDHAFFYTPYSLDNQEFMEKLVSLKIVDISCGSGVFIIATIDVLMSYYEVLNIKPANIVDQFYGYDIQETPLRILKLLLLKYTRHIDESHFLCLDTLLDLKDKSFDIVIGNPPYVGEKGNKNTFGKYKHLKGYEGRMDLFYFFIYKGYELLDQDGILMFITTNYFVTADGAAHLRHFLKSNTYFRRIINLDECKFFSEAKGMHNLIYSFGKSEYEKTDVLIIKDSKISNLKRLYNTDYQIKHKALFSETGNIILYEDTSYYSIIQKMLINSIQSLGQIVTINQGIVSGADKVTPSIINKKMDMNTVNEYDVQVDDPIFVFDKAYDSDFIKPFYKNSDISKYDMVLTPKRWILYVNNGDLDEDSKEYSHLLPFKDLLSRRREVANGTRDWYALQWGRDASIFEREKIVVPQRSLRNTFGYTDQSFYSSADVYYLTEGPLRELLALLNSKLYYFWLYNRGKRKGQYLELYAKPLSQIPIPILDSRLLEWVNEAAYDTIDKYLYDYFQLTNEEINQVERLYNRGLYDK